jgi:peptidyl-prolyl cis-trans isomerase B (cyclophilin B)
VVVAVGNDSKKTPAAAAASSSAAAPATAATDGPCKYTASRQAGANPNLKDVGVPPDPNPTPTDNRTMSLATNRGAITIQMNGALAPCNVQSLSYLAGKGFYNNSSCHRLVTAGIYVLQCGDPSGTGSGGPTYDVKDENLDKATYTTGVVAMANSGANTNSSQFFIMFKDSTSLPKNYTQIGTVTAGMDIIQAVAAGGEDDSNGQGDGKPKLPLTFTSVTVQPPVTGSGTLVPPAGSGAATPSGSAAPAGSAPASAPAS